MDSQSATELLVPTERFGKRVMIITIIAVFCIITIAAALVDKADKVFPYPQVHFSKKNK